jgi:hypothetical protein
LRVPKSRPEDIGLTGHRPGRPASWGLDHMCNSMVRSLGVLSSRAGSVQLPSESVDISAWPQKEGKTVWILDKQPYDGNVVPFCKVEASASSELSGCTWSRDPVLRDLAHLVLCCSPGKLMVGLSIGAPDGCSSSGYGRNQSYELMRLGLVLVAGSG